MLNKIQNYPPHLFQKQVSHEACMGNYFKKKQSMRFKRTRTAINAAAVCASAIAGLCFYRF